jgi:thiamine kinase-like enzyme
MRHFCATIASDQGDFLIKQQGSNAQLFGNVSLTNELLFYKQLCEDVSAFKEMTPAVYHLDFEHQIVVISFINNATAFTLKKDHTTSHEIVKKLASYVATLHTTPIDATFAHIDVAAYIRTHDKITPEMFAFGGPLYSKLLELLQRYPEFNEAIHALKFEVNYDTLIHGDLKYDNILLIEDAQKTALKIIDWELIGIGDRYIDLGYVIGNFLVCIIDDIKLKDNSLHIDEDALDFLQDMIATFLDQYNTQYTEHVIDYTKLSKFTSLCLLNQFYAASLFKNEFSRQDIYKLKLAKLLLVNPEVLHTALFMKSIINSYEPIF